MHPLSLEVGSAKEALVKEFVNKNRPKHLRDAVECRVLVVLLGGHLSLNLIVDEEPCGLELDLVRETSLFACQPTFLACNKSPEIAHQ
jgi:hypothetical protein